MKKCHYFHWLNGVIFHVISVAFILLQVVEVEGNGELGSVECVEGKWKVDTRLMALVMTCPLPLDGNANSIVKMAKCVMNKVGIYDGEGLSDDFTATACSLFAQPKMQEDCLSHANSCVNVSFLRLDWETLWPVFVTCFIPWVMSVCNI